MILERLEKGSYNLSDKEKRKDEYLINQIDATIAGCVTSDKQDLVDAYNLRNGVRDYKDFAYLWEAYGIEFPAQLRHVPVLRAIFDSLVGQAQRRPFKYHISCVDSDSVKYIFDQYRQAILNDITQFYKNKVEAAVMMSKGESAEAEKAKEFIARIENKYKNSDFKADIEIMSKDLLDWAIQRFKLKSICSDFINDLVTAGQCYYQAKVVQPGKKPIIRSLNPINIFYTKDANTKFIKDCERVVYKERLPVTVVWTLYGHKMTNDQKEKFLSEFGKFIIDSDIELIDYRFGTLEMRDEYFTQKGIEVPMTDVHYVEWKSNTEIDLIEPEEFLLDSDNETKLTRLKNRKKYQLDLYEGVRIGQDMHVAYGKNENVIRDPDDPSNVSLTINGICYNDRNGKPYSTVLRTKSIADKIDIVHYHAETLLAVSGVKAIMVNFPDIPTWMGETPMQRLMKWLGMVKQGLAVVDTSQEKGGKFANSGDVDMSLSDSILSLFKMLEHLEATAYKVTGVSRQSVGNITQSDGKGTTELAVQASEVVIQPLFTTYDEIVQEFLTDVVNVCRLAYSEGLQGSIILGEEGKRIFSIQKDKLKLVHLNVHVNGDGTEQRDLDSIKEMAFRLVDQQLVQATAAVDMVTIKSVTRIKQLLKQSLEEQKQDDRSQLNQQLQELQSQLQEAGKQIEQAQNQNAQNKSQEIAIRQFEADSKNQLKSQELAQNYEVDQTKLELEKKRIDLETLQLTYGGDNNIEIKND
jgi:hypothetical protein